MKCMNNIKEYLNKIRKPSSNQNNKVINALLIFILGITLGIFSKWLDNLSIDNTIWWQNIIDILDLKNTFSLFGIWIFIAVAISVYSSTPKRAAINVLLFFIGMTVSYHLYTIYFSGFNPFNYMLIWYGITFISPVLAYITWHSKGNGKLSFIIRTFILSVMALSSFSIGSWYFDIYSAIDLLLYIGTVLILHSNIKNTCFSVILSIMISFLLKFIV